MVRAFAPAKVNLSLHVGPLRPDRKHEIASLVVFADVGDVVCAEPSDDLSLTIDGPFAGPLAGEAAADHLVLRAARMLARLTGAAPKARLALTKALPVASGVGGGSADAAAAIRALAALWGVSPDPRRLNREAFRLGADVPVCLSAKPAVVRGAGEIVERFDGAPPVWICLANPGVGTPTGPIFRAFDAANPAPPPPAAIRPPRGALADLDRAMGEARNDLEGPAIDRVPVIADVIAALAAAPGARHARMSGSGATCYALFADAASAERAARRARARGWWSVSGRVLG